MAQPARSVAARLAAIATCLTTAVALALTSPAAGASIQPGPASWAAPAVTDLTPVRATLSWTSPTTDPEVSYYRIYRVTTHNGNPHEQFVNASHTTSFVAGLLTPDTDYTYFVETGDHTSNGLRSQPVTFRTPAAPDDTEPPIPPGAPEATSIGPNSLTLTWAPSTDNDGVVAYHIYQTTWGTQIDLAAVAVVLSDADPPSWTLQRLLPDFDYAFHVVAVDAAGNQSAASPALSLRTPANPASACQASYTAMDVGGGMFEGQITLVNTGAVHDVWTIRFTLPEGQQALWGAAQSGTEAIIAYEGWADLLTLGERTVFFYSTHTGSVEPATDFHLNGQPCSAT